MSRTGKKIDQKSIILAITGVGKQLTEEVEMFGQRSYVDTDELFEMLDHHLCNYCEAVDSKYYPDEMDELDEVELLKKIATAAILGVASYQCGQIK